MLLLLDLVGAPVPPEVVEDPYSTHDEQLRSETRRWFQATDKWRQESAGEVYAPDGKPVAGSRWQSVVVSDGSSQYDYDAVGNVQTINLAPTSLEAAGVPVSSSGSATKTVSTLAQLFERMDDCYRPIVSGSDTVGGKAPRRQQLRDLYLAGQRLPPEVDQRLRPARRTQVQLRSDAADRGRDSPAAYRVGRLYTCLPSTLLRIKAAKGCLPWIRSANLVSCRHDPPHAAGRVCSIKLAVAKEVTDV
jgi:hypothetical protein